MNTPQAFIELMTRKYGSPIVHELLDLTDITLKPGGIKPKNPKGQELVRVQLRTLIHALPTKLHSLKLNESNGWAFDFPGWLGNLDFRKKNVKDIMIIGSEPHIEEHDYQIVYGLHEGKHLKFFTEDKLWRRILKLLTGDYILNDFTRIRKELNRLYITDVCFFAPQGKVKALSNYKDWNPIVIPTMADLFLREEISLIKPRVIISQGALAFKELVRLLGIDRTIKFSRHFHPKLVNLPQIAEKGETFLLGLPHMASGNLNFFWKEEDNMIRRLRSDIIEKYSTYFLAS